MNANIDDVKIRHLEKRLALCIDALSVSGALADAAYYHLNDGNIDLCRELLTMIITKMSQSLISNQDIH